MESVARAALIYLFLQIVVRITGRRLLAEMNTFDLVLLLIISEATQQGLLGDDFSVVNAWIIIATLCSLEVAMGVVKARFPSVDRWLDGRPTVVVRDGRLLDEAMRGEGVSDDDLRAAARDKGIGSLSQIRHAVVEESGGISIIAKDGVH